ncbi:hypothetical protein YC2023_060471 [Brassica napus]
MEMEHRPELTMKTEEERHGEWSTWAKRALESCGLWSSHGKEKPLQEMTANEVIYPASRKDASLVGNGIDPCKQRIKDSICFKVCGMNGDTKRCERSP